MYKFYWSNLQKTQTAPNSNGVQSTTNATTTTTAADSQLVWTRQNATNTAMPMSGNNPEPLPARGGRPTTVRVTSPSGERHSMSSAAATAAPASQMSQRSEKSSSQHHTPTGSHRVLLKLRRGAQAARPKSVHGVEQLMTSPENRFDRLNVSSDDSPSILETLASLRTGEVPSKSGKKQGMSTSKSMHHFYSRTWTEKTLQRYQHNYENVYNNDNNNDDNPVYENVYFRQGDPSCDNLVIGQMMQSPRTAARMRVIQQQQQQSSPDFYRPFEPPPEPNRSVPPVPPDRKSRNNPKGSSSSKPLYRSKSCERPKMKDAMRDTFRISSDKIQNNFSRLSSNLTDKISSNVMHRFSGGAGSVSSSSRMSTGSTDVSSTTSASNVENQNSLLQAVAMKAIPCVDIQVRPKSY